MWVGFLMDPWQSRNREPCGSKARVPFWGLQNPWVVFSKGLLGLHHSERLSKRHWAKPTVTAYASSCHFWHMQHVVTKQTNKQSKQANKQSKQTSKQAKQNKIKQNKTIQYPAKNSKKECFPTDGSGILSALPRSGALLSLCVLSPKPRRCLGFSLSRFPLFLQVSEVFCSLVWCVCSPFWCFCSVLFRFCSPSRVKGYKMVTNIFPQWQEQSLQPISKDSIQHNPTVCLPWTLSSNLWQCPRLVVSFNISFNP